MMDRSTSHSRRDFLRFGAGTIAALALLPAWNSFSYQASRDTPGSEKNRPTTLTSRSAR